MINGKKVSAIIVAAGTSSRMGFDKLQFKIGSKTVLEKSVLAFDMHNLIDEIIVVANQSEAVQNACKLCKKPCKIAQGGATRAVSVKNGLALATGDFVAIHDAARPYVSEEIITNTIVAASEYGACAPSVKVKDTIKVSDESGFVLSTPPRETLFAVQTPQVFSKELYEKALKCATALGKEVTDDCMLFENAGFKVKLVQGDYQNYKITTPDDVQGGKTMRIGHGYDVHKLVENRKLILGGVEIEFEKGLLGHSDADVLTHAIMDGLLGAAALGDIGLHFPDTSAEFKGADSLVLLKHVAGLLAQKKYEIENLDATLLCQRPKLRPYIEQMQKNIAKTLNIDTQRVNIKATTEEGLGFTGTGDGISAHCVVLLR